LGPARCPSGPAAVTLRRCPTRGPTPRRAHPR
jgi:hypothetical protein